MERGGNSEPRWDAVAQPQIVDPFSVANVSERAHLSPAVAVSTVIFALTGRVESRGGRELAVPLVRCTDASYEGRWALPSGPLVWGESLVQAARRTLREATGLRPAYLEQLYAFGGLERTVDQRVVSIVYWALVSRVVQQHADGSDGVGWFPVDALPDLAFDHRQILDYAVNRLRTKVEYAQIAHELLGESFTLSDLHGVYEAVLGRRLDLANFRRAMLASGSLEDTGATRTAGRGRPARLYRFHSSADAQDIPDPELARIVADDADGDEREESLDD